MGRSRSAVRRGEAVYGSKASPAALKSALHFALRGRALAEQGSFEEAEQCFERAIALNPGYADIHVDLGTVFRLKGDFSAAECEYRKALGIDSAGATAHYNLALLLLHWRLHDEALTHLRSAHRAAPDRGDVVKALIATLVLKGQLEEALQVAHKMCDACPTLYEGWLSLGVVHQKLDRPAEAVACFERARQLRAADAELLNYEAIALQDMGRLTDALSAYDAALTLQPDFPLARFHRALAQLLKGDYARGWPDYELRLISEDVPTRPMDYPAWRGEPLENRCVLIHGEQGLGDEIMFASCLPEMLDIAGHCIIECSPKLTTLFRRSFPDATVNPANALGEGQMPARRIDYQVPVGSLPMHLRRSLADFPSHRGYLKAEPARVTRWRHQLETLGPGLKVGISWQGGTPKTHQKVRSIELSRWSPILKIQGVRFVSLQYTTDARSEMAAIDSVDIASWEEALVDYDETAALVSALDLTISVCTAVVHLAGALGKPVWIMAPFSPEWRYGHAGSSMPWYPSALIFRQHEYGAWDHVIQSVAMHLTDRMRAMSTTGPSRLREVSSNK